MPEVPADLLPQPYTNKRGTYEVSAGDYQEVGTSEYLLTCLLIGLP